MAQLDLLSSSASIAMPYPICEDSLHMPSSPAPARAETAPVKADTAYRTISEVADELDVPQHVLRFWESHFPQVKPSRMRGSRRYYRPADVEMLKTIKGLLYNQGYTIKGAKQLVKSGKLSAAPAAMIPEEKKPVVTATEIKAVSTKAKAPTQGKQALVSELRVLKSMLTALL